MKQIVITALLAVVFSVVVLGQQPDSIPTSPDEQIIVNKEYDENGNLIHFDSTYIFKWQGDTIIGFPGGENPFFSFDSKQNIKELMEQFFENKDFPSGLDEDFFSSKNLKKHYRNFFSDSLLYRGVPDSTIHNPFGQHYFSMPEFSEFFKNFEKFHFPEHFFDEKFNNHFYDNEEQQNEWKKLMENHQKEIDKFKKRWDEKNKEPLKNKIEL